MYNHMVNNEGPDLLNMIIHYNINGIKITNQFNRKERPFICIFLKNGNDNKYYLIIHV